MRDFEKLRSLPPGIFARVVGGAMAGTDALRQQVDALAEHVMTEDDVNACQSMVKDSVRYGLGVMGVPYEKVVNCDISALCQSPQANYHDIADMIERFAAEMEAEPVPTHDLPPSSESLDARPLFQYFNGCNPETGELVPFEHAKSAIKMASDALREDHGQALAEARQEGARYAIEQLRQGVDLTEKQGQQVEALLCAIMEEYRHG